MKPSHHLRVFFVMLVATVSVLTVAGQKKTAPKAVKPMIFAVLNDGQTLEPIAYINNRKLETTVSGGDEQSKIVAFNRTYYKPGTKYRLIFGSGESGTVSVKSSDAKAECSRNLAAATTKADKTPLKGLVMGLATNAATKTGIGVRRRPTAAEKAEIEELVRSEFTRQKLTPGTLRYHNLTALDLENDGKPELVGSYWVEVDRLTRALLFFIAGQDSDVKYSFGYSEYRTVDQQEVMSGDIKNVDEGVYHELLLDAFDYDGDGIANIFTYVQSFEGAGFNVYSRNGNKWTKVFEGSNYHCGY